MSKFTKGKWEITEHLDITCNDVYVALVCHEDHRELFSPQSRANARLIAAAPEMYELLKVWVNIQTQPTLIEMQKKTQNLLERIDVEEIKHDKNRRRAPNT